MKLTLRIVSRWLKLTILNDILSILDGWLLVKKNIDHNIFVKTYNKTTPFYKEHNSTLTENIKLALVDKLDKFIQSLQFTLIN